MNRIVHLGRGKTATLEQQRPEDSTIAWPRNRISPDRLATLKKIKPIPPSTVPKTTRYEPGRLVELAEDQCRFHLDGDLFCGKKTVHKKDWCDEHIGLVYGRAM